MGRRKEFVMDVRIGYRQGILQARVHLIDGELHVVEAPDYHELFRKMIMLTKNPRLINLEKETFGEIIPRVAL